MKQLAGMRRQEYVICSKVGFICWAVDNGCPQTVAYWACWETTSFKGKKQKEKGKESEQSGAMMTKLNSRGLTAIC